MSNECSGDWDTRVRLDQSPGTVRLRGVVHIRSHTGVNITGEFRPQTGPAVPLIGGKCHPIPTQLRALSFQINIGGERLSFRGIVDPINSPNVILCGSFFIVFGPPDPGDTGTWEASKGGLVPDRSRRKAGSKKGGKSSAKAGRAKRS